MFEARSMLFIYVETPLHAGTGRGLGAVDLPIQRERTTGYPIVQASSLKGRLRAAAKGNLPDNEWKAIFGPETNNASDHAGALSIGDARILLFPVRSLAGVFAWTTSRDALARFLREAHMVGLSVDWELPAEPDRNTILVSGDALIAGGSVVLEEFSFTPDTNQADQADKVRAIGQWLADNALPQTGYDYWKQALPNKLCILPEDAFRDFVLYGTEVQTHIKLDPDKKTVQSGALWTTESLPVDTLLYAPLMATKSRTKNKEEVDLSGQQVLAKVKGLRLVYTQLGGDETTGQGMVALRFSDGGGQ
ncbi:MULTISPECIES: type III-B CRISPR module RAMP protein Cmr4 [Caldilinea]|nr:MULTISPECIES: type III-B CRISPR module RAMP protein Cmr4 [Caldilinea]GIV72688.1 MAG: type III-B CRISPR module RAMP protein Cmr4 [Caldilinea sp.]